MVEPGPSQSGRGAGLQSARRGLHGRTVFGILRSSLEGLTQLGDIGRRSTLANSVPGSPPEGSAPAATSRRSPLHRNNGDHAQDAGRRITRSLMGSRRWGIQARPRWRHRCRESPAEEPVRIRAPSSRVGRRSPSSLRGGSGSRTRSWTSSLKPGSGNSVSGSHHISTSEGALRGEPGLVIIMRVPKKSTASSGRSSCP